MEGKEKRNVIVGQSGGPTAAINSSLAGVYRTAIDRGYKKVYGMLHGVQGLMEGRFVDLSEHIRTGLDAELLKRTPSAYLGSCRYKLPEIHDDREVYEKILASKADHSLALYNHGCLMAALGNYEQAVSELRQVAGQMPDNSDVKAALTEAEQLLAVNTQK